MANRAPWLGVAGLLAVLAIASLAGSAVGVGPLAPTTPPDKVTDATEMFARSLQAVLDATAVHLDASVSGRIPGAVIGQPSTSVTLDGTSAAIDLRPRDAKTRTHVESPPLGVALDAVTSWDGVSYRTSAGEPWRKDSLGAISAGAGIDINPLTFVDRLRDYLARSGVTPTVTEAICAGASGVCHRVALDAGSGAAEILGMLLPAENRAALPPVITRVTLDTDSKSLRPARFVVDVVSDDRSVDLHLVVDAGRWNEDIVIAEPSQGS
jgi:hypothetical protein